MQRVLKAVFEKVKNSNKPSVTAGLRYRACTYLPIYPNRRSREIRELVKVKNSLEI